jgi:quaternary ammonium compound-resistance protein SugE
MNAWLIVLIAGVLETGWAMGLKYSEGFTRPIPSIVTIVLALASFWMLSVAMKTLPVGTA